MDRRFATTFDEYVGWLSVNSPHATVLDWWRRLELGLREYAPHLAVPPSSPGAEALEDAIALEPCFGVHGAALVRQMRRLRNRVAHEPGLMLTPEQAYTYAALAQQVLSSLVTRKGRAWPLDALADAGAT